MPDIFTSSRSSRPTRTPTTGRTPSSPRRAEREPVHPQIVAENGPDSAHFHYVHGATVTPVCLDWEARRRGVAIPHRLARRPQRRPGQDGAAHPQPLLRARLRDQRVRGLVEPPADLRLHARRRRGVGHVLFDLVAASLPATPPTCRPTRCARRSRSSSSARCGTTCDIWRYQKYVEHPALAKVDAKPYMAMRKWATQFYEVPGIGTSSRPRRARGARRTPRSSPRNCQGAVVGPERRAGRARRRGAPRSAAQHRPAAARRPRGRRACRALPGAAPARRARLQPQRQDLRDGRQSSVDISPGSQGATLLPEFGPAAKRSRAAAAGTASGRWAAPTSTRCCATSG